MDRRVIIIGAGISGLTVKKNIPDALIIEKNSFIGGLCHTFSFEENSFDCTGHYLHYDKSKIKSFSKYLNLDLNMIKRNAVINIENQYIEYPFQSHFHKLCKKTVDDCILGYMKRDKEKKVLSFYDWVMRYYGEGIGKHFMLPYNKKLWRKNLDKLTAEWVSGFIPKFTDKEIVEGGKGGVGYNSFFYYPKKAGFENIISDLKFDVNLSEKVKKIDINNKILTTDKGEYRYSKIISTIPLPELMKLCGFDDRNFEHSSVYNINLAVRGESSKQFHWGYFSEAKYPFYRVGIPSNIHKNMTLPGQYILSIEISYRGRKNIDYELILKSLKSAGVLQDKKNIILRFDIDIKYGYVIYNVMRRGLVESCKKILGENEIFTTGRYGNWEYSFIAQDIINAERIANTVKRNL